MGKGLAIFGIWLGTAIATMYSNDIEIIFTTTGVATFIVVWLF